MIKTKIIKTNKSTILVIGGLPEDAQIVTRKNEIIWYPYGNIYDTNSVKFPPGKWQPVGFLEKIPEGVAKELVDKDNRGYYKIYDHPIMEFGFNQATESLHSLVEANVKLENSLGKKPVLKTNIEDYDEFTFPINDGIVKWREWEVKFNQWQAEEETVFRNPFLLNKID